MKVVHYIKVASHFKVWTHEFWLALFHDTVEDKYIGDWILKWKSLDAITRRKNEVYKDYIHRVAKNKSATKVKIADLRENLKRCPNSLVKRYRNALQFLNLTLTKNVYLS